MKGNKKGSIGSGSFNIWIYSRGLVRGYLLSLVLFLIGAILITYTKVGENIIPIFTSIVMILSIVYSAIYVAVHLKKKGWLHGLMMGFVYVVILMVLSKIFVTNFILDRFVLYRLGVGLATGAIGGMIGINLK